MTLALEEVLHYLKQWQPHRNLSDDNKWLNLRVPYSVCICGSGRRLRCCSNDKCQYKHSENGMRFFLHEPSFLCLLANYIFIPIIALCLYRFKWNQIKLRNRSCLNFSGGQLCLWICPPICLFSVYFVRDGVALRLISHPIIIAHLLFYFFNGSF